MRLVKGSHIVVPQVLGRAARLSAAEQRQARDLRQSRIEGDLRLIGTTDIPYEGEPEDVADRCGEIDYLLRAVNRYMRRS